MYKRIFTVLLLSLALQPYTPLASPSHTQTIPEIAISIDDAPMPGTRLFNCIDRTKAIIAQIKAVDGPAIGVFALGKHAKELSQGLEQLRLYSEAGHMIANHSYSHYQLSKVDTKVFIEDVQRAHRLFSTLPNFQPFFRFPHLCEGKNATQREEVLKALDEMGYQEGYVTVSNYDYAINNLVNKAIKKGQSVDYEKLKQVYLDILWDCISFYDELALQVLGRQVKHVLLLHANDLAAYYIGDLITFIRSKGWKVIPIQEAYQDPIAKLRLTTTQSQSGRIGAIAKERKANYKALMRPSLYYSYIEKALKKAQVFTEPKADK